MKVLIDQHDVVWVRQEPGARKDYIAEALAKWDREPWTEERLTFRVEVLPDDTVFERHESGAFVISAEQPPSWTGRKAEVQEREQKARAGREALKEPLPADPTVRQLAQRMAALEDAIAPLLRNGNE